MSRRRKQKDAQAIPVVVVQEVQTSLMHCGQRMEIRSSFKSGRFRIRYWVCTVCKRTDKTAYECLPENKHELN